MNLILIFTSATLTMSSSFVKLYSQSLDKRGGLSINIHCYVIPNIGTDVPKMFSAPSINKMIKFSEK